jgi:hypothetical protein
MEYEMQNQSFLGHELWRAQDREKNVFKLENVALRSNPSAISVTIYDIRSADSRHRET